MGKQTVMMPSPLERLLTLVPGDPSALAQACRDIDDWNAVANEAREHGLFGVLIHACQEAGCSVPDAIQRDFVRHQTIASVWHAHLLSSLDELAAIFHGARIPVVALKGPLLAERLYSHGALRPSVDLDLLVSERDLDAAVLALTAAGWLADAGPTAAYARRHHHHLQMRRAGQPPLELHFRARAGFGTVLPSAPLMERSIDADTSSGRGLRTLAPVDEFVYLAVHAAGHGFTRLMWLYDLKLLSGRHRSGVDWNVVVDRAREVGTLTAVAFACGLLRERLSVPVPDHPMLRPRGVRHWLTRNVQRKVALNEGLLAIDRLGGLVFTALLCDSPMAAARLWGHHASHMLKRRLQRRLPRLVPADWAG
jgi:hypothetical protein